MQQNTPDAFLFLPAGDDGPVPEGIEALVGTVAALYDLRNAALGSLHLRFQVRRRQAHRPVAQDDELLQIVGSSHPNPVLLGDLIGGPLNVGVGGFRLLGVDTWMFL